MRDLADFSRELADRIEKGAPLVDCLGSKRGVRHRADRIRLEVVREAVAGGSTLADAFERFPETFDPVYVRTVAAGEAKGDLAATLRRLAQHIEWTTGLRWRLRRQLKGPLLIASLGLGLVLVLLLKVVPIFVPMFADMG